MNKIAIEELLKKCNNNRYLLTILVAKRATKILEKQIEQGNLSTLTRQSDPVTQSMDEIMSGKLMKPDKLDQFSDFNEENPRPTDLEIISSTRDQFSPLSSDE